MEIARRGGTRNIGGPLDVAVAARGVVRMAAEGAAAMASRALLPGR